MTEPTPADLSDEVLAVHGCAARTRTCRRTVTMRTFVHAAVFVLIPGSGYCGQVFKTEILRQNAVPLVTITYANITSMLLPAGDYDCRGNVGFTAPTTATLLTHIKGNISLVSAS